MRERAGLFDVSHMGEVVFRGPDAEKAVQRLVTRDVSPPGRRVRPATRPSATRAAARWTTCSSTRTRTTSSSSSTRRTARRTSPTSGSTRATSTSRSPTSPTTGRCSRCRGPRPSASCSTSPTRTSPGLKYYRYVVGEVDGVYAVISRTGYTGEDGFELYVRPDDAPPVWRRLVEAGRHAGRPRGARHPAPGGRHVPLRQRARPRDDAARGRHRLRRPPGQGGRVRRAGRPAPREEQEGLRKKLVGFKVEGRGHRAPRPSRWRSNGETVGRVTSGTLSPTLGEAIGLALVAPEVEDSFEVVIRDRPVEARAVPLPFYKREKK